MTDARTDFSKAPVWFQWALHEIGIEETPGQRSTPRIVEFRKIAKVTLDGDDGYLPWCAIFVNAGLEANGIHGTKSAGSQSFRHSIDFVKLEGPALGAIAVFWRQSPNSGLGHVAFYRGETSDFIYTLGGNQHDSVSIAPMHRHGKTFGLLGYWWPVSVARPLIGVIPIRTGQPLAPVSVV